MTTKERDFKIISTVRHKWQRFSWTFTLLAFIGISQAQETENLFLITLDGLRWEELFGGADPMLINHAEYVKDTAALKKLFWQETAGERRKVLMPFVWQTIAREGQIYGNRNLGNKVNCSNIFWFSYPGYAEILVGKTNANAIHSNAKIANPDTTFLELLNEDPLFQQRVAAFCSWDVFPFIIHEDRSGITVNAGFRKAKHAGLSQREKFLNDLQPQIPRPWATVRHDVFTHQYALEYIAKYHPKVVYIGYGETDDFAHDGRYDQYLKSAHQTDSWLAELWQMVQDDPVYQGKTTFVITTDHGRGSHEAGAWKSHGKTYSGSNAIWLAVIGPDTPTLGEIKENQQHWQNQVAATCLRLLGHESLIRSDMGRPIFSTKR